MYSIPQHAVTKGYWKIEYLRAQPIASSRRLVKNDGSFVIITTTSGRRCPRRKRSPPSRSPERPRMVKKLDLLESNHGCGLNGLSREKHSKTDVTQRYTVHT